MLRWERVKILKRGDFETESLTDCRYSAIVIVKSLVTCVNMIITYSIDL